MMIGRENLQFAATRLNEHSSRSHCVFTIKIIGSPNSNETSNIYGTVSMLSFCDLAGSERIKKTHNTGDRQKEAGNINSSLLALGRCIQILRANQAVKEPKKQKIVPFRDSKLTRMFQSFLNGQKASMVVNISQAPYLFDESLQVLKFAAIANKITVVQLPEPQPVYRIQQQAPREPETPPTVKPAKPRHRTRFSIMVTENPLMGRGTIAWENPNVGSTMLEDAGSNHLHRRFVTI